MRAAASAGLGRAATWAGRGCACGCGRGRDAVLLADEPATEAETEAEAEAEAEAETETEEDDGCGSERRGWPLPTVRTASGRDIAKTGCACGEGGAGGGDGAGSGGSVGLYRVLGVYAGSLRGLAVATDCKRGARCGWCASHRSLARVAVGSGEIDRAA